MRLANAHYLLSACVCAMVALLTPLAAHVGAQPKLTIKTVKYFGDDDGEPARGNLPANAGSLASAARIQEVGNGGIAVYDAKMKRIVVFDSNAKVIRHIGRYGKGPGEFSNVLSMDYDRGRLAVFDYDLARVTIFDTTGKVIKTVPTGSVNHILLRGDSIWGAIRSGTKNALWAQHINDDASKRVEMLPISNPNPLFSPPNNGVYFVLGRDKDRSALIAHDLPGLWYTVSSAGISKPMGRELLPGAKYWMDRDIAVSPGQIEGIIGLGSNWIGLLFMQFDKARKQGDPPPPRRLAVYKRDGTFHSFISFPEPIGRPIAMSVRPNEFYYVSSDPYYRVVRAVVTETGK